MKQSQFIKLIGIMIIAANFSCSNNHNHSIDTTDPLPSWNEGATKSAIISFVEEVSNPESKDFVEIQDRIATFDNDGNLWAEQPFYFQLSFTIDRVKQMAGDHPEWEDQQPFKAILEDDLEELFAQGEHGIIEAILATHVGFKLNDFNQWVKEWIATAKHPRFNRSYTDLVYQPMLELLDYLRANDFKVFIVSGGGIEFMRAWVEDVYGVPKDQVIGSTLKNQFKIIDGKVEISSLPEIDNIDDKEGKPLNINKFIGRKPIFASGNSDGDLQMLQYTESGEGKRFMLYLHHTDSIREWAYDRDSSIGRLDKGLDEALEKGWTVIDMKKDWKVVFPFEME